jgi:hypothetical protein
VRQPGLIGTFCVAVLLSVAATAEEKRSTGLPEGIDWTFNLDAGVGAFGFNNSLYTNARPDPSGDLSDDWLESFIKPAISGEYGRQDGGVIYGKLSAVGERTFGASPSLVGEDASSFQIEDAYLGWRKDALDLTVGRTQYRIGHGFLLYDGAGEGGSRGGFWSNARKAWEFAGVGRYKADDNTFEVFYVDRDELPEAETDSKLYGANYEYALGENSTLGLSYIKASADPVTRPLRDGMDVYNARAFLAPFSEMPGLAFELEYALEDNGDLMESTAWTAQASYELDKVAWSPRVSYRYAFFEGDDPTTAQSEAWDTLLLGFYDWGAWWQGEIAGEYFLSNSNLISHQGRVHVTPNDSLSGGLIAFVFTLDQPATFAPGVTSDKVAFELDAYVDWKVNSNFTASFVLAYADPDEAIAQGFGRTESMRFGMVYLAYSF